MVHIFKVLEPPTLEELDMLISGIYNLLREKLLKQTYQILRSYLHRIFAACFRTFYFYLFTVGGSQGPSVSSSNTKKY